MRERGLDRLAFPSSSGASSRGDCAGFNGDLCSTSSKLPAVPGGLLPADLAASWSCFTKSAFTLRVSDRIFARIGSGIFLEAKTDSKALLTVFSSRGTSLFAGLSFEWLLLWKAATAAITLSPAPRLLMVRPAFGRSLSVLPSLILCCSTAPLPLRASLLFLPSKASNADAWGCMRSTLDLRPLTSTVSLLVVNMLFGRAPSVGLNCGCSGPPLKLRCFEGEYSFGVYLRISSCRNDFSSPLLMGRDFVVEANWAHIGVSAGLPSEEDGGVVFSLSLR